MTRQHLAIVIAEPFEAQREVINAEMVALASTLADHVRVIVLENLPDHRVIRASGLSDVVARDNASVVILPATLFGRELAPRIAVRLNSTVAADAIGVSTTGAGVIQIVRQVQGGSMTTSLEFSGGTPVITVRPGIFAGSVRADCEITTESLSCSPEDRVALIEELEPQREQAGLATAKRVVSGGRGLGKSENFHLVEELAEALDAAVGASGAVVGMGWRPHSQQVGSTGTTVAPNLYVAVGISGAVQHTIGMSGSEHILAINRDAGAPIFQITSLGVVGDLFEVVPAIVQELNAST